jgi:hypothetical protein
MAAREPIIFNLVDERVASWNCMTSLASARWTRKPAGISNLNGSSLMRRAYVVAAGRRNRNAFGHILVELVAQRADRDAENASGVRPVAKTLPHCRQDQLALDISDGVPDQGTYLGIRRCGLEPVPHTMSIDKAAIDLDRSLCKPKLPSLRKADHLTGIGPLRVENVVNEPHQFLTIVVRDREKIHQW